MAELMASDLTLPDELVEGLIHKSAKTIIIGGSKAFKTWAFTDLAIAIATGTTWWDIPCTLGRVLYINLEIHDSFFRVRFAEVCDRKGIDAAQAAQNVDYLGLRGHAADLATLQERILEYCRDQGYDAIIVDPLYKCLGPRDENSAGDMANLMNILDKISDETGAAIIFGHHFSKGNQSAKDMIDRGAGSGVLGRDPDTIITMTPHAEEDAFIVEFRLRNFPPMQKFVVRRQHPLMVRDEELDPADIQVPRRGRPMVASDADFLELIPAAGIQRRELRASAMEQLEMSDSTFKRRLRDLIDDGVLTDNDHVIRRVGV